MVPPYIVVGALSAASGLGQSARLCYEALRSEGEDTYGIDLTRPLMQPSNVNFPHEDGRCLAGAGTLIIHANGPLLSYCLMLIGQGVVADKFIVGYWAWELEEAPPDWAAGAEFVHELWAPSRFCARSFRSVSNGKPVRVLPHPVAVFKGSVSRSHEPVFFCFTSFDALSSVERKNPWAAIRAFRAAFGHDKECRLILHARNISSMPSVFGELKALVGGAPNIVITQESRSHAEIADAIARSDVVLSLHRSEGFGLIVAEALLAGVPAISTNWSGTSEYLHSENGVPIDYRLVPCRDPQRTYNYPNLRWADPDLDHAVEALRALRSDGNRRRIMGMEGRRWARNELSSGAYTANIKNFDEK